MTDGGKAVLLCVSIFLIMVACSVCRLPRRKRMFTNAELDEIRVRKEEEKELLLESKIEQLQQRKRLHTHNRMVLTARLEVEKLADESGTAMWDAKGRTIYGDAWDVGDANGGIPLKELFNMPESELRAARIEAANRVMQNRELEANLEEGDNTPLLHEDVEDRRVQTARANRRSSSSQQTALGVGGFDDARFVTPRTARRGSVVRQGGDTLGVVRDVPDVIIDFEGPIPYSIQAPGLANPAPPPPIIPPLPLSKLASQPKVTKAPSEVGDIAPKSDTARSPQSSSRSIFSRGDAKILP